MLIYYIYMVDKVDIVLIHVGVLCRFAPSLLDNARASLRSVRYIDLTFAI